jgi:hypothetical protein
MSENTIQPELSPPRDEAIPESYALYVDTDQISVWQYRASITAPDGQWHFVEKLGRENDPRLTLEVATLKPPTADGYWIYSRSYDCRLDCA